MAKHKDNLDPRINNRRALHDYFIEAKLECGISLMGSEVKSLRLGRCTLNEAFARVEGNRLILHGCHIDPYEQAGKYNHDPLRDRVLLVHKRELRKLEAQTQVRGTTLVPLAVYFKEGLAKVELGVAKGKQQHDKRATIREKEQKRDLQRAMMKRG
jgi:SsrA-binding protein